MWTDGHRVQPFGVASVDGSQRIWGREDSSNSYSGFFTQAVSYLEVKRYILGSGWEKCHQTMVT